MTRLQIIVVDDGSTDETSTVLEQFKAIHQSATIITQSNAGVSKARNAGLALVTAPYVCFLDADDLLRAGCLVTLQRLLEGNPNAAAAFGTVGYISESGAVVLPTPKKTDQRVLGLEDVLERNFTDTPGAVLFRTSAVVTAGAFDPSISMGEDWELYVRVARIGPIMSCGDVAVDYRLHEVSAMRRKRLSMIDFETTLRKVFSSTNIPEVSPKRRARLELRRRAGICQLIVRLSDETTRPFGTLLELASLVVAARGDRMVAMTAALTIAALLKRVAKA